MNLSILDRATLAVLCAFLVLACPGDPPDDDDVADGDDTTNDDDSAEVCQPDCEGRVCGPDGCGGSCGECDEAEVCLEETGLCCAPDCADRTCGDDGCGGSCGVCADDETCIDWGDATSCQVECDPQDVFCADNSLCIEAPGTGVCVPGAESNPETCSNHFECERGFACIEETCRPACDPSSPTPVCPSQHRCVGTSMDYAGVCASCQPVCTEAGLQIPCDGGTVAISDCVTQWVNEELTYHACTYSFSPSGWSVRIEDFPGCAILDEWNPGICTGSVDYCIGHYEVGCHDPGDAFGGLTTCAPTACTSATCTVGPGCSQVDIDPGMCEIDGFCRTDGELDPTDPCMGCDAAADPWGWSPANEGGTCNDLDLWTADDVCVSGVCQGTPGDCADWDGDGYGVGDCAGTDCNDYDASCWIDEQECCTNCSDLDGDGYGVGTDCPTWDCNDADPACWSWGSPCCSETCADDDLDQRGIGACLGVDCNDADILCWQPGDVCCPTGTASCTAAVQCLADSCGSPAEANCVQSCLESADAQAQALFEELMECMVVHGCAMTDVMCGFDHCYGEAVDCADDP